jgi:CRISPR type III-A-associated RAMP protein Csm5
VKRLKYKIEVLSPIHIGSGISYKPIDYIENREEILIFDERDVLDNIQEIHMLNNEFLNGISYTGKRTEYYKNLDYFIDKGIIKKSILNKARIRAKNMSKDLKAKEIKGIMRNIQGPYIPGGTIKGIIRTAIFYDYIKKKGIDFVKKGIEEIKRNKKINSIEDFIIGRFKKDIVRDPFKFLRIRDVNIQGDVAVYEEHIFNTTSCFPTDVIEVISQGSFTEEFEFKLTIKDEVATKLELDKELVSYLKEEKIIQVLYTYAKDIIEDEIEYFTKNSSKTLNSKEILQELVKFKDINTEKSPILRIGKSTGYKSHTLGLAVKYLDENYYKTEFIRYIRPHKYDKRYEFPKTRKIIGNTVSPKLLGFTVLKKVD